MKQDNLTYSQVIKEFKKINKDLDKFLIKVITFNIVAKITYTS